MKRTIGENIRRLRRECGMTQERLAELMGVSSQAVSKWESQTTYPDITALIPLSEIFRVSVDELMGHSVGARAARCAEVKAELRRIQYDDRQSDEAYLEAARQAAAEFPADEEIQHELAWAIKCRVYFSDGLEPKTKENLAQEAEKILLRLIDTVTDEELRCRAVYTLVDLYANGLSDSKRAQSAADRLPKMEWCREIVKADAFSGGGKEDSDLAVTCQQEAILELTGQLCGRIQTLSQYATAEDGVAMRRTANRIYGEIYGGNIPWEILLTDVSANHLANARTQAAQGRNSDALNSLEEVCRMVECAAKSFREDGQPYTSPFLDRLTYTPDPDALCRESVFRNQIGYRLRGLQSREFDVLRGDERFVSVAERLKTLEKTAEE